jgi:hypothetical protein
MFKNARNGKFKKCTKLDVSKNSRNKKFKKCTEWYIPPPKKINGMEYLKKCMEWEV